MSDADSRLQTVLWPGGDWPIDAEATNHSCTHIGCPMMVDRHALAPELAVSATIPGRSVGIMSAMDESSEVLTEDEANDLPDEDRTVGWHDDDAYPEGH
ncbi:hypothetical protein ACH4VR_25875 [Streptomyces sp. NPDC020883]|uniref:hypothetical protein n=1 Tax=Streptomyces sp. NPDC020883 TaxID=3365099 RepID=UPI003796B3F5